MMIDPIRRRVLSQALRSHRVWIGEQFVRHSDVNGALQDESDALDAMLGEIEGPLGAGKAIDDGSDLV